MANGRGTRLTPELAKQICDGVRLGLCFAKAVERLGLNTTTAWEWLSRGKGTNARRPPKPVYVAFARDLAKAQADDIARRIGRIEQAARGGDVVERTTRTLKDGTTVTTERYSEPNWTADAWHLERSYPKDYGRRLLEHSGPEGGPIPHKVEHDLSGLSDDELKHLKSLLLKAKGAAVSNGGH